MKHLKKSLLTVLTVFTLFMVGAHGMEAKAATIPNDRFSASYSEYTKKITVGVVSQNDRYEVALYNAKGALVGNSQCSTYAFFNVKLNKLYYYQVRGLDYDSQTRAYVPATDWSARKAICTLKYKSIKPAAAGNKKVRFKAPKITGVKKYTLYMSTNKDKGFKKAGTIKPGKTLTISKCKGKAFKYYKHYFYKIVPVLKKKAAEAAPYQNGFYLTRTYRFR